MMLLYSWPQTSSYLESGSWQSGRRTCARFALVEMLLIAWLELLRSCLLVPATWISGMISQKDRLFLHEPEKLRDNEWTRHASGVRMGAPQTTRNWKRSEFRCERLHCTCMRFLRLQAPPNIMCDWSIDELLCISRFWWVLVICTNYSADVW